MKRVNKTGGNRMIELGKKAVQLWFREADLDTLREMAAADVRPVTQYIMSILRPLMVQYRRDNFPTPKGKKGR